MHMEAASTHILSVRVIVVMQLVMWVVLCCSLEQGIHWETRVWTGSRYTWSTYTATRRSKQNWALLTPVHLSVRVAWVHWDFPPRIICTNEYHHKLLKTLLYRALHFNSSLHPEKILCGTLSVFMLFCICQFVCLSPSLFVCLSVLYGQSVTG